MSSPSFPNPYIVYKALSNGRKASEELKGQNRGQRYITAGHHVEGVSQDFVLHGANTVCFFSATELHNTSRSFTGDHQNTCRTYKEHQEKRRFSSP
jgi:hypothetical protein